MTDDELNKLWYDGHGGIYRHGTTIAKVMRGKLTKQAMDANAQLIVDAVNEKETLEKLNKDAWKQIQIRNKL